MEESYSNKLNHEAFISGHEGSSPTDVILSVMPIVPGSILAAAFTGGQSPTLWNFTKEYVLCILPLILSFTILQDANLELCAVMFFLLLLRISQIQKPFGATKDESDIKDKKLGSLTSSRATVNIATIIAILAVDFHIFPRRFSKTEKYGCSLMDVGAACYLFMNGITDFRKKMLTRNYVKDILILCLLGLLRLISVKLTNYQEHVSEYGTHCNFFFTLSAIKILNMLGFHKLSKKQIILAVIGLALVHQIALLKGLEHWVMSHEDRIGFMSQNREWFVSLPGNFLIYLIGHLVGDFLLGYNQRYKNRVRRSVLLPVFPFIMLFVFNIVFEMNLSRRVANLPFIMWIVGFFLLFLTIFEILENLFGERSCLIFKSINNYSLLFFLLGNLFTGLINILVNTLEVSNFSAFIILNVYCFSLCFIVYIFHSNKRKTSIINSNKEKL